MGAADGAGHGARAAADGGGGGAARASLASPLLRLDTNSALPEAAGALSRTGWTEIARFNDDPYPDLFFEKRL